jgi:cellulase/cellobiase CelA1
MKKSIKFEPKLMVIGAIVLVGLGLFYGPIQQYHNASGAYGSPSGQSAQSSSSSSSAPPPSSNSSLALSVKEAAGVYKWTNATTGTENPELNLRSIENNTIKIQNPTDTKHELIIESQGKEVASSGDILPGASGQVSFSPNGTGTFSYHCEYHPDTMKGTIKLTGP